MWVVYLLLSKSYELGKRTYVGITTDMNRRLKQHNGELMGGSKYTRAYRPYEVAYFLDNIPNRSIASKFEYDIKQQKSFDNRINFMKSLTFNHMSNNIIQDDNLKNNKQ